MSYDKEYYREWYLSNKDDPGYKERKRLADAKYQQKITPEQRHKWYNNYRKKKGLKVIEPEPNVNTNPNGAGRKPNYQLPLQVLAGHQPSAHEQRVYKRKGYYSKSAYKKKTRWFDTDVKRESKNGYWCFNTNTKIPFKVDAREGQGSAARPGGAEGSAIMGTKNS